MAVNEGYIPSSVTCLRQHGGVLGSLIHPHPTLWGVHAFPAFFECCLSAPPSTKEPLTAINYGSAWTKGIPLCWNISAQTDPSRPSAFMPRHRDSTWPLLVFEFDKWTYIYFYFFSSWEGGGSLLCSYLITAQTHRHAHTHNAGR